MKVLVINSPLFREKNANYDEDSLPPIGLGLIATALAKNGFSARLIDAVALNMPLSELFRALNEESPDCICINVFTTNLVIVKDFIEGIRTKIHIVIGGLSTKSLYNEIFSWSSLNQIDIVYGDGERIICDLLNNRIRQKPIFENIKRRYFEVQTDSPYYVHDITNEDLDRSHFVNEPVKHPFGFTEANIITSRGCIYNCAFCAAARSLNKQFGIREKSTESIIAEIKHITQIYPKLKSIRVLDDLFLKNASSVDKAIAIFNNLNIQWRSMAHVQTFKDVDMDTIRLLKDSGCNELFIGIESGSPKILKQIHKTPSVDIIKANLTTLLMCGINVKGYFIYGFPGETEEDFRLTYALAEYLKKVSIQHGSRFRTSVFQFRPYHGTELYHTLENEHGGNIFSNVALVEPNQDLSALVGRLQFNFHSGNYSSEDLAVVHEYISKTTKLNSMRILAAHGTNNWIAENNFRVQ